MTKRIILIFLICFFSEFLFSQQWPFIGIPAQEKKVVDEIRFFVEQGNKEKVFESLKYFEEHPDSEYFAQFTAFSKNANEIDPKIQIGVDLYYAGEYEAAKKISEDFLKDNPGNYKALELHVLTLAFIEPNKSLEECDKVLTWVPFDVHFLFCKGLALHNSGEKEDAVKVYTIYTKFKQDDVIYNRRGMSYQDLGKYKEALSDYTESIRLNPKNSNKSYQNRAGVYFILEKYEEAKGDAQIFLKGGTERKFPLTLLSLICNATGNFDEALKYANRIVELSPVF